MGMLVFRNNDFIGNDVIDVISAQRSRIAKIADLNRRGTKCKNAGARFPGEPGQIDGNIDLLLAQKRGHFHIVLFCDVDKMFERAFQSNAHLAAIVAIERNGDFPAIFRWKGMIAILQSNVLPLRSVFAL